MKIDSPLQGKTAKLALSKISSLRTNVKLLLSTQGFQGPVINIMLSNPRKVEEYIF